MLIDSVSVKSSNLAGVRGEMAVKPGLGKLPRATRLCLQLAAAVVTLLHHLYYYV